MMKIFGKRRKEAPEALSWSNVPIDRYIKAEKAAKIVDEDAMKRTLTILSILKGKDFENVPISEYMEAVSELNFMGTEIPKVDVPNEVVINGHKYTIKKALSTISTAQFIDFANYCKMEEDDKLVYMLSCFCIPEGYKNYADGYDVVDVIEDMRMMPTDLAYSISFFFNRQSKKSWHHFRNYLMFQIAKLRLPLKKKVKLASQLADVWQSME